MVASYDEGFQALVAAAAQAVEVRGMAAYWLLAPRNRDLVASLADMRKSSRASWLREDVLPAYEEVKINLSVLEAKIDKAEKMLRGAYEKKDKKEIKNKLRRLTVFGESYMYWRVLLNSCRDVFDAVWQLGITVPVPDFEDERVAPRGGGFLALLESSAGKLHKKAKSSADRMDKKAKTARPKKKADEYTPIEREEDPRKKPLDSLSNRIQFADFEEEGDEDESD